LLHSSFARRTHERVPGFSFPTAGRSGCVSDGAVSQCAEKLFTNKALGVIVALFAIGWMLTRELYSNSKIEDCVMSGRTNCVPIDTRSSSY
jgi:hypothetical protein